MKFVTRVSSFFAPSTVTGGQTDKSYILFCLCTFSFATPRPAQKETWHALNPCLIWGTAKRLYRNTNRRHATWNNHVTHPTYPASVWKFWRFSDKAKYARLRTLPPSLIMSYGGCTAVLVRITRLLFSTVHCATANKRFCLWLVMRDEIWVMSNE